MRYVFGKEFKANSIRLTGYFIEFPGFISEKNREKLKMLNIL